MIALHKENWRAALHSAFVCFRKVRHSKICCHFLMEHDGIGWGKLSRRAVLCNAAHFSTKALALAPHSMRADAVFPHAQILLDTTRPCFLAHISGACLATPSNSSGNGELVARQEAGSLSAASAATKWPPSGLRQVHKL